MPITPYLNGVRFDPETRRILGVALEIVCIALRTGDCDEYVKQAIATKIIDLAKAGERNPDLLCERVLEEIRGPQGVRASPGPYIAATASRDARNEQFQNDCWVHDEAAD
jgi:hypothetical protein